LLLDLYRAQFGRQFDVDTAQCGTEALERVAMQGPYAVVVADMHMPEMSGAEFLRRMQELSPDTVRIMITADDRQEVAVEAINWGHVYRFLSKSASPDLLAEALHDAVTQHISRIAELDLLDSTFQAGVNLLIRLLSEVNPLAHKRAIRVRRIVDRLCLNLEVEDAWEVSAAALLSQVGCITIPDEILRKVQRAGVLTHDERQLYSLHPQRGRSIVAGIPRLERVAEIIARQERSADPAAAPASRGSIVWRASLLKLAIYYDGLLQRTWLPRQALEELAAMGEFDAVLLDALAGMIEEDLVRQIRWVLARELHEGMRLIDDVLDDSGAVLLTGGKELTEALLERLQRQIESGRCIREPIRVIPFPNAEEEELVSPEITIPQFALAAGGVPGHAAAF
jgi:CheY-like chemotaxis protein